MPPLPRAPPKCVLTKEMSQGHGDCVIVLGKAVVVPRQAEERVDRKHRARWQPVQHSLDLLLVHGHTGGQNHMAQVPDLSETERLLRLLGEEVVLL
jgi:hypothetical protein